MCFLETLRRHYALKVGPPGKQVSGETDNRKLPGVFLKTEAPSLLTYLLIGRFNAIYITPFSSL